MDIVFKKAVMNVLFSHRQQNQIANLTQKKIKKKIEWLLKMLQRLYVCIPFIYMYAYTYI